jgi:hypothetical protein
MGVEEEQLPLAFWGAIGTGQILLWQAYRARLLMVPGASPPRLHEGFHETVQPRLGHELRRQSARVLLFRSAGHDPLFQVMASGRDVRASMNPPDARRPGALWPQSWAGSAVVPILRNAHDFRWSRRSLGKRSSQRRGADGGSLGDLGLLALRSGRIRSAAGDEVTLTQGRRVLIGEAPLRG